MNSTTRGRMLVGLAVLGASAYALPLFFPPTTLSTPPAGWLETVFPGVPPLWIVSRLIALIAGVTAGALLCRAPATPARAPAVLAPPSPWRTLLAVAVAAAVAVAGLLAPHLSRAGQLAFVAGLGLPIALLLPTGSRSFNWRRWILPTAVAAGWLLWRLPAAWHNPRSASIVDVWLNFDWVQRVADPAHNFLTGSSLPGMTDLHLAFAGVPFFSSGSPPSLEWIQTVHCLWIAVDGLLVFALAAHLVERTAAALATAVFLFSPITLFLPFCPQPFFGIAVALTATLLLACASVLRSPTAAGIAAIGALCGIAGTIPSVAPFALIGVAVVGVSRRRGAVSVSSLLVAGLLLAAPIAAGWRSISALPEMAERYLQRHSPWGELELILMGQVSPLAINEVWDSAAVATGSIAAGAFLAPFAVPRTPLRLWADTLFDPLGALLAALGVALCVRAARRLPTARLLLGLLLFTLLPGITSSYDRPSLTRLVGLPVLAGVLAAIGFAGIRDLVTMRYRTALTAAAIATVIAGGAHLFDNVNPRLLRSSWVEIALESIQATRSSSVIALDHPIFDQRRGDWLNVERTLAALPARPLATRRYSADGAALRNAGGTPAAEVFLWSPALEADYGVADSICAASPGGRIFEIFDRAGLSYSLAAAGGDWQPNVPRQRWRERQCSINEER